MFLTDVSAASAAAPPVWPYIAGGVAAILTAAFGAWRIFKNWRSELFDEAQEKLRNTEALQANTEGVRKNSELLEKLSAKMDSFQLFAERTGTRMDKQDIRIDRQDARIEAVEKKTSRPPRRKPPGTS